MNSDVGPLPLFKVFAKSLVSASVKVQKKFGALNSYDLVRFSRLRSFVSNASGRNMVRALKRVGFLFLGFTIGKVVHLFGSWTS